MDPQLSIIDAHHHLWDLQACHYPWLMAKGVKRFFGDPTPIQKDYLVQDFFADIGDLPVSASVHIQVGVDEDQAVDETRWLQSVTDAKDSKGFPQGIVAFCNLVDTGAMEKLQEHRNYPNLRGLRQIVGRSPEEDANTGSAMLLDNPIWIENLSRIAEYDLSFDLQLIPSQISKAREIFVEIPELKVALCHCGSPFDQSDEGLSFWKTQIKKLAELPNIYCKISGFGMFDHEWTVDSIRPIIINVIDIFTPERCMFGSNFPVEKLHADYHAVWNAYMEIIKEFSLDEKQQLFADTARNFYSIN